MDEHAKLLVEVTPKMLKTIQACAVVRQARMQDHANRMMDDQMWEIHDAALTEKERSYQIGAWAERLLQSLSEERIDDEWFSWGERLARFRDFEEVPSAVEVFEGVGAARSSGSPAVQGDGG